jgi:VIT1/CCC1 family predicted Fe2+/Mn2+ transporter
MGEAHAQPPVGEVLELPGGHRTREQSGRSAAGALALPRFVGEGVDVRATRSHSELHLSYRSNWLRAAVLGANDGIVSTASLILGVAASGASRTAIVTAGVAGLVAGASSMAAGEYVSVSSQRDSEQADLRLEARELREDPEGELRELAGIYERRGLSPALAAEVADALSRGDVLEAHARDELGLAEDRLARPLQASGASAVSFAAGAALPLVAAVVAPSPARVAITVAVTLVALGLLGDAGARLGGAPRALATARVVGWGAIAMAVTAGIGALVGTVT